MERGCLLLILSLMTLQESASKSTFSDWRAPTNNLTGNIGAWRRGADAGNETTRAETESKLIPGNQWPWAWGVSRPQNFYDSLYNHYAPITNFQVDLSNLPEIPTATPVEGTNARAVVADEVLLKTIEDLQKVQRGRYDPSLVLTNNEITISNKDLADQRKKIEDLEKYLADQTKKTEDLGKSLELTNSEIITLNKDLADQTKKTEDLEKDLADQTKKSEDLEKDLADQTKKTEDLEAELKTEVEAREAGDGNIKREVDSIDGRLEKTEKKKAVCGYKNKEFLNKPTPLGFDRIYDEVESSSGEGTLEKNGYFTAGVAGIYFITLETKPKTNNGEWLDMFLLLSSGNYNTGYDKYFIQSRNDGVAGVSGFLIEQASASRYVSMEAGETLHISMEPHNGVDVEVWATTMCVSLYSASG